MTERVVPVLTLIKHRDLLDHLASFSEAVEFANFTVSAIQGLKTGKYYVASHGEMEKSTLRGVNVLNTYYLERRDAVTLTKKQYDDFIALVPAAV